MNTPDRCYTTYDATDKDEVSWRLENCFNNLPDEAVKNGLMGHLIPPKSDADWDTEADKERAEARFEEQAYRDL